MSEENVAIIEDVQLSRYNPKPEAEAEVEGAEPETETTETAEPQKPAELLSPRLEQIVRRENQVRIMERDLKEKLQQVEEAENLLKEDPWAFIESRGQTYEDLINKVLNPKEDNQQSLIEEKLKKLEEREAQREKQLQEQEQQKLAQTYINRLNDFVEQSNFELIRATGAQQTVIDTIVENYRQTGNELSFDQACSLVENYLENEKKSEIERLKKVEKFKTLFGSGPDSVQEKSKPTEIPASSTLLNKTTTVSSGAPKPEMPDDFDEYRKQLKQRALSTIK